MQFIIILLCVGSYYLYPQWLPQWLKQGFNPYVHGLRRQFKLAYDSSLWQTWVVVVIPPVLVTLLLSHGLGHGLLRWMFDLLIVAMGFAALPAINITTAQDTLLNDIIWQAYQTRFAVIFWYLVLGPVGVVLYGLSNQLRNTEHLGTSPGFSQGAAELLDWPVVRVTALSFAIVGHFSPCLAAWLKAWASGPRANQPLLFACAHAAVNDAASATHQAVLDSAHGLIKRSLLLWLMIIGLVSLLG